MIKFILRPREIASIVRELAGWYKTLPGGINACLAFKDGESAMILNADGITIAHFFIPDEIPETEGIIPFNFGELKTVIEATGNLPIDEFQFFIPDTPEGNFPSAVMTVNADNVLHYKTVHRIEDRNHGAREFEAIRDREWGEYLEIGRSSEFAEGLNFAYGGTSSYYGPEQYPQSIYIRYVDGHGLQFIGTDTRNLRVYQIPGVNLPTPLQIFIPRDYAKPMIEGLRDRVADFRAHEKSDASGIHLKFASGNITGMIRLAEPLYPDFEKVIPEHDCLFRIGIPELRAGLAGLNYRGGPGTKLHAIVDSNLNLSVEPSEGFDVGAEAGIPIEYIGDRTGDGLEFDIRLDYLADLIENIPAHFHQIIMAVDPDNPNAALRLTNRFLRNDVENAEVGLTEFNGIIMPLKTPVDESASS